MKCDKCALNLIVLGGGISDQNVNIVTSICALACDKHRTFMVGTCYKQLLHSPVVQSSEGRHS